MSKKYAVLPCNGLDKCAGTVTREVALELAKKSVSEILCPVFYRVSDNKYNKLAQELPLLVIDGCATRCASKLAGEKGCKIAQKINITDIAKEEGFTLPKSLDAKEETRALVGSIVKKLMAEEEKAPAADAGVNFPAQLDYEEYKKDKFLFRLPKNEGFWFSENDMWLYADGNKARVGITSLAEKNLMDIMFFTPPDIGDEIEQFDEAGEIESSKAVFELICPVSGTITAINEALIDEPELINENPYEKGWIIELEMNDLAGDSELLLNFSDYLEVLKRKVDEFHV